MTSADAPMHQVTPPHAPLWRTHAVLAAGLLLTALLVLTTALLLWRVRERDIADWQLRSAHAANMIATHARQSFKAADLALDTVVERIRADGAQSAASFREKVLQSPDLAGIVSRYIAGTPQISYVGIVAADGTLLRYANTSPRQPINLADRDYFRAAMQPGFTGTLISAPVQSRVDGEWTFFLVRQIRSPAAAGAQPLGLVMAAVHVAFFQDFYGAVNLGEYSFLLLFRRDGTLLARNPPDESWLGKSLAHTPVFRDGVVAGRTNTVYITDAAGISKRPDSPKRIAAVQVLDDVGLVTSVTVSEDLYLARWYTLVDLAIPTLGMVCIAILLLTAAVGGLLARQDRSTAILRTTLADLQGTLDALRMSQVAVVEKTRMLDLTLEHMDQGIAMILPDRRIPLFNRRALELLDLPAEFALQDITLQDVMKYLNDRGEYTTADAPVNAAIQSDGGFTLPKVYTRTRPNGTVLEIRSRPLPEGGVIRSITDVSLRTRVEAKLREAHRMEAVGQLTAGIAHDFNNVLGVIVGNLELAIEQIEHDAATATSSASEAREAAMFAGELVERLLAFSQMRDIHLQPTDLKALLESALPVLRRAVFDHLDIALALPADLWPAMADRAQLQNALINLAINARAATQFGSPLRITASNVSHQSAGPTNLDEDASALGALTPGDYVQIAVADEGIGMSDEIRARVFEPFFTTHAFGTGSGLGLSMVLGTLRQMGGTACIRSAENAGTIVTLYLPRASAALIAAPPDDIPRHEPSG